MRPNRSPQSPRRDQLVGEERPMRRISEIKRRLRLAGGSGHHGGLGPQPVRGRRSRRVTWWNRAERQVEQGVHFAADIQVGGGDEYIFVPDSEDEDGGDNDIFDDGEFVPDSLVQEEDVVDGLEGEMEQGVGDLAGGNGGAIQLDGGDNLEPGGDIRGHGQEVEPELKDDKANTDPVVMEMLSIFFPSCAKYLSSKKK